ncbi:hypothetical protein VF21_04661 [Pseudogymnoascus sp. 05NY08]|nr:hypothetical protein VF21_04661 [Pseudogymnoascus sp. 05NY08]
MELKKNRPTDAEAWTYLAKHGNHIKNETHRLPKKVQDAIAEVLKGEWDAEVVDEINIHFFGLIWSDKHYKKLATKLRNGPAAEAFNIEVLNKLKTYRLEGYWDVLLENAADWLQAVFKKSTPHVLTKDLYAITMCSSATKLDYISKLCSLFWERSEAHKTGSRKEEFLSHLSFTEYSEAYNTITAHPWHPRWNFPEIVREIREFASPAKRVMLHVAFWYNPKLTEPHGRENDKKPVHYHLEHHFRKAFPQKSDKDSDKAWKSKAIALQRVVIDFTMENWKDFKGPFMATTSRFNRAPEEYSERFRKDMFWDRLALRIRLKMPEIPFQHRDLLPYNSTGDNIYHSDQRQILGQPSSAHPKEDALPIVDLTTGEGGLVDPEIEDLFRQEFGSDSSSSEEFSDTWLRASISAGNKQTPSASTHTNHLAPGKDDPWAYTSPPPPPPGSAGPRKRKTPNGSTPKGSHRRKLVKLKLQQTAVVGETATGLSASASDGQQSPTDSIAPRQRPKMDTNLPEDRESIRLRSQPPAQTAPLARMFSEAPEEIPLRTTEIPQAEPPPSESRQASPHSVVSSAANRGEPVHSASRSASVRTTEISQAQQPLTSEVKEAVEIMLDEFADKRDEQVATIEKQVATMEERIADMTGQIEDMRERVNAIDDQLVADKLNMEKQAAANKLNIKEQVTAIQKQVDTNKLRIDEQTAALQDQLDAMKEQVKSDKLSTKEQVDAMKKQVDTIEGRVNADKLNTKEQVDAMETRADTMKEQFDAMKDQVEADNIKEQVAAIRDQVEAMKEQVETDNIKGRVAAIKEQVEADKLSMNEQVDAMKRQVEADKLHMEEQFNAEKFYMNEQYATMKDQVDTMEEQFTAMKKQVAFIKPTNISQAEPPSKIVLDAVDIVVKFLDELNENDQIVTVDAVLNENIALIFSRLPVGMRKAWLYNKIGVNRERNRTE